MYFCQICNQYARLSLKEILRHMRDVHRSFSSPIICGVNDCPSTASSYESLRQHMYKKHRDELIPNTSTTETENVDQGHDDRDDLSIDHFTNGNYIDEGVAVSPAVASNVLVPSSGASSGTSCSNYNISEPTAVLEAAKYILKLRDGKGLTQVVTDSILGDIQTLINCTIESLEKKVMSSLVEANKLSSSELAQIRSLFSSTEEIFKGINTEYKQETFFEEKFSYVPPQEMVLGSYYGLTPRGDVTELKDYFYYVPLLSSLQALLNNEDISKQVFQPHNQTLPDRIGDYCDGDQFKNHPLFTKYPNALQLILFYDDLETCNALGSKAKIHKLSIFYYVLGNLPPRYRSILHVIQLLCVVQTQIMQKYTINQILMPFMSDLKKLESESGVPFIVNGERVNLHGTLVLGCGDNPAANLMSGYKCLTSAYRKCRTCMATAPDIQTKFHESECLLRSREMHSAQCANLELHGPLYNHFSTTYGLSCDSVLNYSKFFHIVDGMIPDIMHDILEGCLQMLLKYLLRYFVVQMKYFTVDTLNTRIRSFHFGSVDSANRPSSISSDTLTSRSISVKQSSSQAWCFGRFLPLLIGDIIPEHNEYWNNFLSFLKIMEYIFAPVLTHDKLDYLQALIQDFLIEFKPLYPERPLTPKAHYLLHFSTWAKRCGPLVKNWCMRFEGKHRYFKKMAQTLGNFKNIAKTVAIRHQRYMCYKLTCCQFLVEPNTYGSAKKILVNQLEYATDLLQNSDLGISATVYRVSYAKVHGIKYSIGCILLCGFYYDDQPLFGKLIDVIATKHLYRLIVKPYLIKKFNAHFNAFEVELQDSEYLVLQQENLADYHPLSISKSFDSTISITDFVVLKYHVFP